MRTFRVERQIERQNIHARFAEEAEILRLPLRLDHAAHGRHLNVARGGDAARLVHRAATLISGSSPLADAVTRSTGTGASLPGSAAFSAAMRPLTASICAGLLGPKLEPLELLALFGIGPVADGRPQKYFGDEKDWPISEEPTALPSDSMMLPPACEAKATLPMPVTASG